MPTPSNHPAGQEPPAKPEAPKEKSPLEKAIEAGLLSPAAVGLESDESDEPSESDES